MSRETPNRPLFQINTTPEEWNAVARAAELAGIAPNTLARALFRWVFPLLASEDFDMRRLREIYGESSPLEALQRQSDIDLLGRALVDAVIGSTSHDKMGKVENFLHVGRMEFTPELAAALKRILESRGEEVTRPGKRNRTGTND